MNKVISYNSNKQIQGSIYSKTLTKYVLTTKLWSFTCDREADIVTSSLIPTL